MSGGSLVRKLGIRPGMRCLILALPDELARELAELPEGATRIESGRADHVLLFVRSIADLARHAATALAAYQAGGHLWIAYPKKTGSIRTDISRDVGWTPVTDAGFLGVTQIALDATWSALRFRPEAEIPKLTRRR